MSCGGLGLNIAFDPSQARVGSLLTLRLQLINRSDHDLNNIQIDSDGPWETYLPVPTFAAPKPLDHGGGWTMYVGVPLAVGTSSEISLQFIPREVGLQQFTFAPHASNAALTSQTVAGPEAALPVCPPSGQGKD
jgi:hypothetical protein